MKGKLCVGMLFGTLALSVPEEAGAIAIGINCAGMLVGTVDVNVVGAGVSGTFTSNAPMFPTLAAAAAKCGEDHFNWYQILTADNMPPVDAGGNRLAPPYVDPPPGGYGNDPNTGGDDTQWADMVPWYWDEGADPPAGTPGFMDGLNVADNTTATTLMFEDFPGGPDGTTLTFMTWLVSLDAWSGFHSWHEGFTWMYVDPLGPAPPSIMGLAAKGAGVFPAAADYDNIIGGFERNIHVPEPTAALMLALGFIGLAARRGARRKRGC